MVLMGLNPKKQNAIPSQTGTDHVTPQVGTPQNTKKAYYACLIVHNSVFWGKHTAQEVERTKTLSHTKVPIF